VPRYYFDRFDGDQLIPDKDGLELPSVEVARVAALQSSAEMIRDMPASGSRQIVAEVSDDEGRPLFRATLWFDVEELTSVPL
jgi:hypothetical protein